MIDVIWPSLAAAFCKPALTVNKVPRVLVFIPDGNRRWAKHLGKVSSYGHDVGLKRCRELVRVATLECGIPQVVFWGASYSNLVNRPAQEVSHLVALLKEELRQRIQDPDCDQTRFRLIGHWRQTHWADNELKDLVNEAETLTAKWSGRCFTVLFGYDFRMDMVDAVTNLYSSCPEFESLPRPEREMIITQNLSTGYLGDVDFIIRTGSNRDPHWSASFLGWNVANAQLAFLATPWPAFGRKELLLSLKDYGERERRGGT